MSMKHLILYILALSSLNQLGVCILSPSDFDRMFEAVEPPLYAASSNMGSTINGNSLKIYSLSKIKHRHIRQLANRKAILIDSQMHARQPYSLELIKDIAEKVIRGQFSSLQCFLEEGVIIFFPFVNIDGYYQYVKSMKQIRKNMNTKGVVCNRGSPGVDINRNFPANFGTINESKYHCGEEYHGAFPFSETEAKVFQNLFSLLKVILNVDIHSYGDEWIYPYASDSTEKKLKLRDNFYLYERVIQKLKAEGSVILSCWESLHYIADGVYIDWAADQGSISLAYEVGKNFNNDENINSAVQRASQDFKIVFQQVVFEELEHCKYYQGKRLKEKKESSEQVSPILIILIGITALTIIFWSCYRMSPEYE